MGANNSAAPENKLLCTSREVVLRNISVSPVFSPFIARESVNICYLPSPILKQKFKIKSVHSPDLLVKMMINCHDQIQNYQDIIEAVITGSIEKDDPIIKILNTNFSEYIRMFVFRDIMMNSFIEFSKRSFRLFKFLPPPHLRNSPDITFNDLLECYTDSIILINGNELDAERTKKYDYVTNFFDGALPPSTLTPPLENNCFRTTAHQCIFEGQFPRKHGICTNGAFLFLLAGTTLNIFPLTENGALSQPMTRILRKTFSDSVSMTATSSELVICDSSAFLSLSISEILQLGEKEEIPYFPVSQKTEGFYLTDGVTNLFVDKTWRVRRFCNGVEYPEVQLRRSRVTDSAGTPRVLPSTYIFLTFVTNGQFIGIVSLNSQSDFMLRVFSLQTGEHVRDDTFTMSEDILSGTLDITHRCYYLVHPLNNNRMIIRRYHFFGSDDPGMLNLFTYDSSVGMSNRKLKRFAKCICGPLSSTIGTQVISSIFVPKKVIDFVKLLDITTEMLELPQSKIKPVKEALVAIIQSIAALIHANLVMMRKGKCDDSQIKTKLIKLITLLPTNIAVHIFFSNLSFFFKDHINYSTSLLVGLFQRIKWAPLYTFAITALEQSEVLGLIPFSMPNQFTQLIPSNTASYLAIPQHISRLLIAHQRILVSSALKQFKEEPFADIAFISRNRSGIPKPIDNLGDYLQIIVTNFDSALSMSSTPNELQNSLIFMLFDNFIRLISSLVEYHSIARVTTALISVLLTKISDFMNRNIKNLDDYPMISNLVLTLLFAYGKFASTLVKGGGLSEFESKCMWIMRANIDLVDHPDEILHLDSSEIKDIKIPRMVEFLNGEIPAPMKLIYKKHKAPFHKNLSDQLKMLDRIVISAICKHTDLLDQLLSLEENSPTLDPKIKKAADQMMKVRNKYRNHIQKGEQKEADEIRLRALMLLRMGSKFMPSDNKENLISEFLTSEFSPNYVKTIIKQQRTRIQVTLVGFALIDKTYSMRIHPLLNDIIAYTLSSIDSFEGLAVIMRITPLKEGQIEQMKKFFNSINKMIRTTLNNRFTLIALKFFRDIDNLKDIQLEFLHKVIGSIEQKPMFALALSIINCIDTVPESFLRPDASPAETILASEIYKRVPGNDEIFKDFTERILACDSPLKIRTLGRVVQRFLNQPEISEECYYKFFKDAIPIIGKSFVEYKGIDVVSEIINIFHITINHKQRAKTQLIKAITDVNLESSEYEIAGSLAILSNYLEPLHSYCNARFHQDRSTSTEVICVPTKERNTFSIYQKPLSLYEKGKTCVINPPAFIYAVPLNPINQKFFTEHKWILSFFNAAINENRYSNITQSIYVQVVVHFMKDANFMNLLAQEQIDAFSVSPVPFGNVTDILALANTFYNKKDVPQYMGFNVLKYASSTTTTLLSPQIKPDAKFSVKISTTNTRLRGHIGIVSDTIEGLSARYALAQLPSGTLYPACEKMRKLNVSQKYVINIDVKDRTFTIDNNKYEFPLGKKFRVIIAYHEAMNITIECDDSNFDRTAFSPLQEHACLDIDYKGELFKDPEWISKVEGVPDIFDLKGADIDVTPVSYKERMRRNFIVPCNSIIIHPQFATAASKEVCMEAFRGLFRQVTCQWMTIGLVRVACERPEMIKNEKVIVKLFSILSVLLEQFYPNEFKLGRFPFSLEEPIWNDKATTNLLYLSLDIESKKAMKELSKRAEVPEAVGKCIKAMASDPYLHLIAYPNRAHKYSPPGTASMVQTVKSAIVTINSFAGRVSSFFSTVDTPATVYKPTKLTIRANNDSFALSVFNVSPMDNSWIFETPFEMLILLKSYISMCNTNEQIYIAKSSIIDSLVANSPFIYTYIPQFLELLQVTIPSTPFDSDSPYKDKLILLGSHIKLLRNDMKERLSIVYSHEQRILMSDMAAELSYHFPEFFNSKIPKPTSDVCEIPYYVVDPGALKGGFMQHILMIRLFARKYTTLVGFPFWEILPLWYRISSFYKGEKDYIGPDYRYLPNGLLCFTNPSRIDVEIIIRIGYGKRIPPDSIITMANSETFDDPSYIMFNDIGRPISTKNDVLYFSLISVPGGWRNFNIKLNYRMPPEANTDENKKMSVNVAEIHDSFMKDMEEFALNWTDEDTDALLNVLPRNALSMPTFSTIDSIAKQSTLAMKFSSTVVSLRALLIHHFNYIKLMHKREVPDAIWVSLSKFVSCEDASDEFNKVIANGRPDDNPGLIINRHAAHRLILDGKGDPSECIIHQLARAFIKVGPSHLRCPVKPWRVKFVGEDAIDAGGPGRELMTEAAASIFEPTSQLTYPVPNARHKVGKYLDLFVPYDAKGTREDDFYAIGVYLGIVVRTGLVQDLPFVPFVFKFLAGGELNSSDITMVDNTLHEQFEHLKEAEESGDFARCAVPWNIEQWDGTTAMLPGHSADSLVGEGEVESYINECINFRINAIKPTLTQMREGFIENICVESHPLLTGSRLSHMVQGSNVITTQQLRSITVVQDFSGIDDPFIVRFFKAVDKLNADQRKMLLKFITTLTRLPNTSINKDFVIKIDRLVRDNPDESLPTASTCFNKLHLPCYTSVNACYQKLIVAIQYCQTMENK